MAGLCQASLSNGLLWMNCVLPDGIIHLVQLDWTDPKPIRIGATLHSLAATRGKIQCYKLYARCYGAQEKKAVFLRFSK